MQIVQIVHTKCRYISDLPTLHYSMKTNTFRAFSANKSNYMEKRLTRARDRVRPYTIQRVGGISKQVDKLTG